jgi:hypothetical protein
MSINMVGGRAILFSSNVRAVRGQRIRSGIRKALDTFKEWTRY